MKDGRVNVGCGYEVEAPLHAPDGSGAKQLSLVAPHSLVGSVERQCLRVVVRVGPDDGACPVAGHGVETSRQRASETGRGAGEAG